MMEVKIFEAFSGYGSQSLALKRLYYDYPEIKYQVVGFSEIDKYAIKAYNALHPNVPNYGDVTTIDWKSVPDFDLLTWSSPCTNISTAGKQEGMAEDSGTASSFIWSIKDCLAVKHPKYILVENVANIVGKRFIDEFNKFQELLKGFGYVCHCNVMNAKNFGVPQNRKRLFLVARRSDMPVYYFPKPFPLKKRLKDVLEENVDESYYLKQEQVDALFRFNEDREKKDLVLEQTIINDLYPNREPRQYNEYAPTLRSEREGLKVKEQVLLNGDKEGNASTITTGHDYSGNITNPKGGHKQMGVLEYDNHNIRIRRLTPRELYRLMDVDEEDIDILLDAGIPKTQHGKLAGNSIVVSCLYYIFRNMFVNAESDKGQQLTLF